MNDTIRKFSAGGIICNGDKVLTIKWLSKNWIEFPKGTIEKDETKENACTREVFEETGYKTNIVQPLGDVTFEFDWSDGGHYRKTVYSYLLELADNNQPTPEREDNEDYENIWMTIDEAKRQLTYDTDKEFLQKAIGTIAQL